ncbi:MAG: twin-arginine translocase subunit TatC, partial [Eudoraea sp.]
MAKASSDPNEMSFLDHLEELRWHLIRSTSAIVL